MDKIFIAEIKTESPFGFKSCFSFNFLVELAILKGDWISVHTNEKWGGKFEHLNYIRKLTKKPILAKGLHQNNDDIKKCLDLGADYVLCVNFIPSLNYLDRVLLEPHNLDIFYQMYRKYPFLKFVYNSRDLNTGEIKNPCFYSIMRKKVNWLCQASHIKSTADVKKDCNAFIIGEQLVNFCNEY